MMYLVLCAWDMWQEITRWIPTKWLSENLHGGDHFKRTGRRWKEIKTLWVCGRNSSSSGYDEIVGYYG